MLSLVACVLAVGEPTIHNLSFSGPRDWTYDARLVVPSGERSGLVVLMIGGGIGNDLDWTVPATLEWNGDVIPMTIDGTTHRDAPRISSALAAHGHAVMHYSTIAREDPKRDRWPYEMTTMAPTELLAEQHWRSFSDWLQPLGIQPAWLSGSQRAAARRESLAAIEDGRMPPADAVQPTKAERETAARGLHAVLQENVRPGDFLHFHCQSHAWQICSMVAANELDSEPETCQIGVRHK